MTSRNVRRRFVLQALGGSLALPALNSLGNDSALNDLLVLVLTSEIVRSR